MNARTKGGGDPGEEQGSDATGSAEPTAGTPPTDPAAPKTGSEGAENSRAPATVVGRWSQPCYWIGMVALGLVGLGVGALLVWLFVAAPGLYPASSYPDAASRAAAISAARTAAMAGFVGLAAVGTLMVNAVNARTNTDNVRVAQQAQATAQETAQQTAEATRATLQLTRAGQLTERYVTAVELLGADNEMSVLGSIYALERLSADSGVYRSITVQILAAYIRTRAGLTSDEVAGSIYMSGDPDPELSLDEWITAPADREYGVAVLAALTVLGRIAPAAPAELTVFDAITPTKRIAFAEAVRAGAAHADLRRTNLRHVELAGTDLRGVNFARADLTGANLCFADLRFARFEGADLTRAALTGAKLMGARLTDAYLKEADIAEAFLGPSEYPVEQVALGGAHLGSAVLAMADLRGVHLQRVRGLRAEQLERARADAHTTLPPGMPRPSHWPTVD